MQSPPAYFPALDTLRLYAAICVIVEHIPMLSHLEQPAFGNGGIVTVFNMLFLNGYDAVSLFFVLSGFLITYLLLKEHSETDTVSVKRFYVRRALRIMPLYYLLIPLTILVVVMLGHQDDFLPSITWAWALILLLAPHIPVALVSTGAFAHIWSIGVEEWFYFAYPPLVRRFSLLWIIGGVIVVRLILAAVFIPRLFGLETVYDGGWIDIFRTMRFECMAIGALGAWIFMRRSAWLPWLYRFEIPALALFLVAVIVMLGTAGILYDLALSLAFMVIIVSIATNPRSLMRWRIKPCETLGRRTYGIYMYHMIAVMLVLRFLDVTGLESTELNLPILYLGSIALSIAIAVISYRFFERRFLKMKDRYSSKQTADTPSYAVQDMPQQRSDGLTVSAEIS